MLGQNSMPDLTLGEKTPDSMLVKLMRDPNPALMGVSL